MEQYLKMKLFRNKTILITGGTGSFGKFFVRYALKSKPKKLLFTQEMN